MRAFILFELGTNAQKFGSSFISGLIFEAFIVMAVDQKILR